MAKNQPNILYILSDQHAFDIAGCYGDDVVRTPNIDRLAARGVRFENAYTASPLCVPARMSLLTGQYPSRQKCWTNSDALASDIPTTAHALGAAGYRPILVGRMHAIGPDQLHGFAERDIGDHITDWYGGAPYSMGVLEKAQRPFLESLTLSGPGQMSYEVVDRAVTERTLERLEEIAEAHKAGNTSPFALHVGYMLPHQPYVGDPELFDYYIDKVAPPRLARPEESEDTYLNWWRSQTGLNEITLQDELRAKAAYYALVETMDREIGKILDRLEALSLTDNTLIVYASDHGDQLGERDLWWKQTFYDQSAKVPLILSWPGHLPEGETRQHIVNLVDLSATLVDAGDGPELPNIDGKSLLPIAMESAAAWANETFSEYCTDGLQAWSGGRVLQSRMIRSGKWKYNYYHGSPHQLFDLESDPDEMNNLIDDPDCQEVADRLKRKILADWNPGEIDAVIRARNPEKAMLKAWASHVKPADSYKYETRAEDNWLT